MSVVMPDELDQDALYLAPVEDQKSVEALSANGPYEPLAEHVRPRRADESAKDPHAVGAEHLVESDGELGVSIPDQEPGRWASLGEDEAQVASLLDDPLPRRRGPLDGASRTPIVASSPWIRRYP